jgi:uncharacterized protein YjdB
MSFISVTDIANVPTQAYAGQETELTGTVVPANAKNKTIEWSIVSGHAAIVQKNGKSYVKPTASGKVTVRATIRNGVQQ